MSPELVKEVRDKFSGSPIKITCDNMIIIWDRSVHDSIVLWDDANEKLIVLRPNTEENQGPYAFEMLHTEYEHIQFMEAYATPKQLMDWLAAEGKAAMSQEQYEDALKQYKQAVQRRGLQSTIVNPNVRG